MVMEEVAEDVARAEAKVEERIKAVLEVAEDPELGVARAMPKELARKLCPQVVQRAPPTAAASVTPSTTTTQSVRNVIARLSMLAEFVFPWNIQCTSAPEIEDKKWAQKQLGKVASD